MNRSELKSLLDEAYGIYARPQFIEADPILIPSRFSKKEDIEIAGFLASTIAWGQRKSIIASAEKLMNIMDNVPHDFIINHEPSDRNRLKGFVHRTFQEVDAMYFMERLQRLYNDEGGLESAMCNGQTNFDRLSNFHNSFFDSIYPERTKKHVSNPSKGSSAKRLNMYLRWMVRESAEGIDFGIWKSIKASSIMIPLDVHTATVGRKLGLLKRKQNDWKSVEELTNSLKDFDPNDPVKYDFALFGLGVSKAI